MLTCLEDWLVNVDHLGASAEWSGELHDVELCEKAAKDLKELIELVENALDHGAFVPLAAHYYGTYASKAWKERIKPWIEPGEDGEWW